VATNFHIIDLPSAGLNFMSGSLPAFAQGAGITYDIRYTVAGSSVWRTYASNVSASQPFSFSLPQPGDVHYTAIGFFFGDVPAGFGLGNTISLTFMVSQNPPGNSLTNFFVVSYGYGNNGGGGEGGGTVTVIPPPPTNGPLIPDGPSGGSYIELDDNGTPQGTWTWDNDDEVWIFDPNVPQGPITAGILPQTGLSTHATIIAALFNIVVGAGLGTLIIIKRKRKNQR